MGIHARIETEWTEHFWSKVAKGKPDECWPWTAGRFAWPANYGAIWRDGRTQKAHRWALILTGGEPPADKPKAIHSCDNPPCCNPNHLRWGTVKENAGDMMQRGRWDGGWRNGERHANAKLTDAEVAEIRTLSAAGITGKALAAQFGVCRGNISLIINHKSRTSV